MVRSSLGAKAGCAASTKRLAWAIHCHVLLSSLGPATADMEEGMVITFSADV